MLHQRELVAPALKRFRFRPILSVRQCSVDVTAVTDGFRAYVEGSNAMSWVTLDLFVSGLALLLAGAMVLYGGSGYRSHRPEDS